MRKSYILLVGFVIISQVFAQEEITTNIGEVFIQDNFDNYSTRLILANGLLHPLQEPLFYIALGQLDKGELRILRNIIFAKHGLIFKSSDLNRIFSRFPWYKGTYTNVDNKLTPIDKLNIEIIKTFEMNALNKNITAKDITGHWEVGFPVAAGSYYPVDYKIDGTFSLGYNTMAPKKIISTDGTWIIKDGYLQLTIKSDLIRVGGYYVKPYASYSGDYFLETEQYAELIHKEPIVMNIPIRDPIEKNIAGSKVIVINIGGWEYIRFSD